MDRPALRGLIVAADGWIINEPVTLSRKHIDSTSEARRLDLIAEWAIKRSHAWSDNASGELYGVTSLQTIRRIHNQGMQGTYCPRSCIHFASSFACGSHTPRCTSTFRALYWSQLPTLLSDASQPWPRSISLKLSMS